MELVIKFGARVMKAAQTYPGGAMVLAAAMAPLWIDTLARAHEVHARLA